MWREQYGQSQTDVWNNIIVIFPSNIMYDPWVTPGIMYRVFSEKNWLLPLLELIKINNQKICLNFMGGADSQYARDVIFRVVSSHAPR